jgi:hypothetical protein
MNAESLYSHGANAIVVLYDALGITSGLGLHYYFGHQIADIPAGQFPWANVACLVAEVIVDNGSREHATAHG